jgi:hypothetical protein
LCSSLVANRGTRRSVPVTQLSQDTARRKAASSSGEVPSGRIRCSAIGGGGAVAIKPSQGRTRFRALPVAGGGYAASAWLKRRKGEESQGGGGDARAAQAARSRTRSEAALPQGRRWGRWAWLCCRCMGSIPWAGHAARIALKTSILRSQRIGGLSYVLERAKCGVSEASSTLPLILPASYRSLASSNSFVAHSNALRRNGCGFVSAAMMGLAGIVHAYCELLEFLSLVR